MNEGQQGRYSFYEKTGRAQCPSETVWGKLRDMHFKNSRKSNEKEAQVHYRNTLISCDIYILSIAHSKLNCNMYI